MSHCPKVSIDQSLMARNNDQTQNGVHGKISITIPNRPESQIKHTMCNTRGGLRTGCTEEGEEGKMGMETAT
jgi:hypothetical protein